MKTVAGVADPDVWRLSPWTGDRDPATKGKLGYGFYENALD
jgi:hypothetical protein